MDDYSYLKATIELASRGLFRTSPNPQVGCILVRDKHVVGQGWHQYQGGPHAEIYALQEAGGDAVGATAYVSLEPCSHKGLTGPCTQALIKAGVVRVVVAMVDINPLVAGQGLQELRQAGLQVELLSELQADSMELNKGYVQRITIGRPWLRLKLAVSLDARSAAASGASKWITGSEARADVQLWRARSAAIITGSGTVVADDPHLGLRTNEYLATPELGWREDLQQPLRVVLDRRGRVPKQAQIFTSKGRVSWLTETLVDSLAKVDRPAVPTHGWTPAEVLQWLAKKGCNEVLLEAGPTLAGAFLVESLVDEILVYMAPIMLGSRARPMAFLEELFNLDDKIKLEFRSVQMCGQDLRIIARVV